MLRSSGKMLQASMLYGMLSENLDKEQHVWKPFLLKVSVEEDSEIHPDQRDQAVKWLLEWNHKCHYTPETFMQSASLLDRFLMAVKARPKYLQCIAFSCFFLAAKLREEDENVPATEDLIAESGCRFSVAEVLRMELTILDKLRWDLTTVLSLDFLQIYHAMLLTQFPQLLAPLGSMTPSRHLSILTARLGQCLVSHRLTPIRPAMLALGLLSLELEVVSRDWLTLSVMFQQMIDVDNQQLIRCRELITATLMGHPGSNAVYIIARPTTPTTATEANTNNTTTTTTTKHDTALPSEDPTKTAVRRNQLEEDDDIYASIKRLYNEDTPSTTPCPSSTPNLPTQAKKGSSSSSSVNSSCSSQLMQENDETLSTCPPLQSIQVT